jgi:hypothetical protein
MPWRYLGRVEIQLHCSCTRWKWVVSFTPLPLYLQEYIPDTHFVGSRVELHTMENRIFPCLCRGSNKGLPARNLIIIPTELSHKKVEADLILRFLQLWLWRRQVSSWMWRRVTWYKFTDMTEECSRTRVISCGGVRLSPFGTSATNWPIVPAPDDDKNVEQSVEWELAGGTEVLGENLTQCHFVHNKSHMTWSGLEPGPPRREAGS